MFFLFSAFNAHFSANFDYCVVLFLSAWIHAVTARVCVCVCVGRKTEPRCRERWESGKKTRKIIPLGPQLKGLFSVRRAVDPSREAVNLCKPPPDSNTCHDPTATKLSRPETPLRSRGRTERYHASPGTECRRIKCVHPRNEKRER